MYLSKKSYESIPNDETPLCNSINVVDEAADPEVSSFSHPSSLVTKITKSTGTMAFLGAWCGMLMIFAISPQGMFLQGNRSLSGGNTIKMCVKEYNLITTQTSVGATVRCVDKDFDGDDFMGDAITGTDGCAEFSYRSYWWGWDPTDFFGNSPDIVCTASKTGFIPFTPKMKTNHDENNQAYFEGTLFRDRVAEGDYGETNKCGPEYTAGIPQDLFTMALGFGEQCDNHDKCYYDCKILQAFSNNFREAHDFCDNEFKVEMFSLCNRNHGDYVNVGDDVCRGVAETMYRAVNSDFTLQYYTDALSGDKIYSCEASSTVSENTSRPGSIPETNIYD